MADFASSGSGSVYNSNASYATARGTAGYYLYPGKIYIQHDFDGANYQVFRGPVKFDTSVIPVSSTILTVKLGMTPYAKNIDTHFDVIIKKHDWSGQDPITDANKDTYFDGALAASNDDNIWQNTSVVLVNTTYESGLHDPTWVVKGGITYYSILNSNDVAGTPPSDFQTIQFYAFDDATVAYRPYLVVTYTTTTIKTINGVAQASVKTVSTIAIAACKKIAGVDNV